jgi:hypothetical protein
LAYFAGALVVDGLFRGAAFCKYVCPIGQFHFVQSMVSPLEVRVREPAVCAGCRTHDCLRGRGELVGCELHLFQPRKAGNLDCTFCLDCATACPQSNVGVLAVLPAATLWHGGKRSGIGQLAWRVDYAALAALLVFGALANAAGMVGPVVELERRWGPPNWSGSCCRPAPDWLLKAEIVILDVGLLASLYAAWRVGVSLATGSSATSGRGFMRRAIGAFLPWALLITVLFALAVWILLQPMEMRGTMG